MGHNCCGPKEHDDEIPMEKRSSGQSNGNPYSNKKPLSADMDCVNPRFVSEKEFIPLQAHMLPADMEIRASVYNEDRVD